MPHNTASTPEDKGSSNEGWFFALFATAVVTAILYISDAANLYISEGHNSESLARYA